MTTRVRVGDIGDIDFIDITPEAVMEALLAHPRIKRVWFKEETGEFAALTDVGMAIFRVGFSGEPKTFS